MEPIKLNLLGYITDMLECANANQGRVVELRSTADLNLTIGGKVEGLGNASISIGIMGVTTIEARVEAEVDADEVDADEPGPGSSSNADVQAVDQGKESRQEAPSEVASVPPITLAFNREDGHSER